MKYKKFFQVASTSFAMLLLISSCNNPAPVSTTKEAEAPVEKVEIKPDMAKVKADIQTLETAWANADNARDTNAVAAFYDEDAVSFPNNKSMLMGKAAIKKDISEGLAKRAKGATITYDVLDVFGNENTVTETGKTTVKDATGKVTYTGKYMAVWEKRSGKYLCVRDMGNDDIKAK